jgi:hypothetical protein
VPSEALGLGFDDGAKIVAAQRALSLEMDSDGRQVFVGPGFG